MALAVEPVLVALDIGSKKHHVAWECGDRRDRKVVENKPQDLRALFNRLTERFGELRIVMEATGVYFLDAALIAAELGAQVMVVNPKASHNFAKAMSQRSKTDKLDAAMLLEFLKRMPFKAWVVPSQAGLEYATTAAICCSWLRNQPRRRTDFMRCKVARVQAHCAKI